MVEACITAGDAARSHRGASMAVCAVWDEKLRGLACRSCGGLEHEELMVVCDRCNSPYHREC